MKEKYLIMLVSLLFMKFIVVAQITDKEGHNYTTKQIGKQVWVVENLDVSHFRNGEPIMEAESPEEWTRAGNEGRAAWCYYKSDIDSGKIYHRLYNWFAVNDPRGLAPDGWHVPSILDWTILTNSFGGLDLAGAKMKSATAWDGTDESGITFLPGGYRNTLSEFNHAGKIGSWWSSTEASNSEAWSFSLGRGTPVVSKSFDSKRVGLSVRCLKD
jgi:uncharacterized protein (TIGR02145 family)